MAELVKIAGVHVPGSSLPLLEDCVVNHATLWTRNLRLKRVTRKNKGWTELEAGPPTVVAGDMPSNVTGEIDSDRIPGAPALIVQATEGEDFKLKDGGFAGRVSVQIGIITWDDAEDKQGHRDVLNLVELFRTKLWDKRILEDRFALCEPWINWQRIMPPAGSHPLYFGLVLAHYSLQVATPDWDEGKDYSWVAGEDYSGWQMR
jgi:hypothetical protein